MSLDTDPDPITPLVQAFQYGRGTERWEALRTLARLGPEAAPAVSDLVAALRDADLAIRQGASVTLASIGAPAVTPLIAALLDEDIDFRKAIVITLGKIGPAAAPAVSVLHEALKDEQLAPWVAEALADVQPRPLGGLRRCLQSYRSLALFLLGVASFVTAGVLLTVCRPEAASFLSVAQTTALACGLLGCGLGAVVGGTWGRYTGLIGCVAVGIAGYGIGLVMGSMVESLLGPLVQALEYS